MKLQVPKRVALDAANFLVLLEALHGDIEPFPILKTFFNKIDAELWQLLLSKINGTQY